MANRLEITSPVKVIDQAHKRWGTLGRVVGFYGMVNKALSKRVKVTVAFPHARDSAVAVHEDFEINQLDWMDHRFASHTNPVVRKK